MDIYRAVTDNLDSIGFRKLQEADMMYTDGDEEPSVIALKFLNLDDAIKKSFATAKGERFFYAGRTITQILL